MNTFKSRKQNRLKEYDYSEKGYYYVTICTHNREEIFGIIDNNCMILNECGEVVKNAWLEIPHHFSNIELDEYIIMPNHIHAIVIINNPVGDGHARPSNLHPLSSNKNSKNNNLSVIIGSFKSAVTKQINQTNNNLSFKWQRSYHDHIIRTTDSLYKIREYITNNPAAWDDDENNIKNYTIKGQACLAPTGQKR